MTFAARADRETKGIAGRPISWLARQSRFQSTAKHVSLVARASFQSGLAPYRSGRSRHWIKVKNPEAPAVKREAEEDWGRSGR